MSTYLDLEDSLYQVLIGLFPEWRIIFAFNNGPEPVTPYAVIDVKKLDPIGREYVSTLVSIDTNSPDPVGTTTALQDFYASVRFEILGKNDTNMSASEMAHTLQAMLRTPKAYELMAKHRVALHKLVSSRRLPFKRETDMYMIYQLDCQFAYTTEATDDQDWIAGLSLDGIYHDAGREPDHVIHNHIDINTN